MGRVSKGPNQRETSEYTNRKQLQAALLTAALSYARKGWQVFPCHTPTKSGGCSYRKKTACPSPGKHGRTKHGVKDATTEEAQIRKWWEMWPDANIGIATGRVSGIVVIDADTKYGGPDTWRDLQAKHGAVETLRSRTGGGGDHHALAYPEGVTIPSRGQGNQVLPGCEVKSDGALIIAPPSRHVSGNTYEWDAEYHPDDMAPAPMPSWLVHLLQADTQAPPPRQVPKEGNPVAALERVVAGCAWLRHCRDDAATLSEPSWYAMLSIVGRCAEGQTQAHVWSAPYPGYTPQETDKKLAHALEDAGPRTCQHIRSALDGEPYCQQCPHWNQITSPLVLGLALSAQEGAESYTLTDTGNAERLIDQHGADLHYCYPWKSWLVWRSTHWAEEHKGETRTLATRVVKQIAAEVPALQQRIQELAELDPARADELEKYLKALQNHRSKSLNDHRLGGMLSCAQSIPGIPVVPDELNQQPMLLNVLNGTLDLETGKLAAHERTHLLTQCLAIPYDPNARCDFWRKCVWDMLHGKPEDKRSDGLTGELVDFVQRAIGYSLTGYTIEKVFFLLWGATGDNGKTTFINVLKALLGPYAQLAQMSTFYHRYDVDRVAQEVAEFFGKRVVHARETKPDVRLSEDLIKIVTGNDPVRGRILYKSAFTFTPEFKLWLAVNDRPVIRGTDPAIWNRPVLIPFTNQFPRDRTVEQRLVAELPGILAWAVEGCLSWQKHGLQVPDFVRAKVQDYRQAMDDIGQFFAECCLVDAQRRVQARPLHQAYQRWGGKLTEKAFSQELEKRGFDSVPVHHVRYWLGIGLLAPYQEEHAAKPEKGERFP